MIMLCRKNTLSRLSGYLNAPGPSTWRSLTTLGIRREDPQRIWERRVALTPDAIKTLIQPNEVAVEVESCQRRCILDVAFSEVGAKVVPRLSKEVDIVLGIKEPPVAEVEALKATSPGKKRSWMVFSHTHKGQAYNTGLLSSFMAEGQSLVDHELLTALTSEGKGDLKRVAAFGWYAGAVGAGEALSMTGLSLLKKGMATPLLHLPRPYTFSSLAEYKEGLRNIGNAIRAGPSEQGGPLIIGLTGAGNVSQGVRDMLDALGAEWADAAQLPEIAKGPSNQVFACAVHPSAYFERADGKPYSREDYYASPESYTSSFSTKIAPYLTTLVNGAGWKTGFPRIISDSDLSTIIASSGGALKLAAVQDVTCDMKGNLEFVDRYTTIDEPYFQGPAGILISSVDILPTELAKDASQHFSNCLLPYIKHLVDPKSSNTAARESIERAMIVKDGALATQHQWLQPRVDEVRAQKDVLARSGGKPAKRRVLLLGSGLVAGPAVKVFSSRSDVHLVIASNHLTEARGLLRGKTNVEAISLDVSDQEALSQAVSNADVIVSLLPAPMHVGVAKHCIKHKKHLVTASYISPEMKALDEEAQRSEVVLLGECGLDPGIDSMAAMRILDRVQREGRKVTSFVSWCGGLPEPAASNVPLGYKFSWSPRAVLTAAQNDAKFKLNGQLRDIAGPDLLKEHFPKVELWKGLALEGLANRDSIPYADKYALGPVEGLKDLYRGTLRYQGFSKLLDAFRMMGLMRTEKLEQTPQSWQDVLTMSIAAATGERVGSKDVVSFVGSSGLSSEVVEETKVALDYFGLLDGRALPPLPTFSTPTPLDYFAALLSAKLAYLPHERDSALLHHSFKLAPSPGSEREAEVTASLLCYGSEDGSAMSITVGKTLAFAALRVLDGHVKSRGVQGPYKREVWEGVLDSLEEAGVRVEEQWN